MRMILTASEKERIESAIARDEVMDFSGETALEVCEALIPWLPYWTEGLDSGEALRAVIAHAEVES